MPHGRVVLALCLVSLSACQTPSAELSDADVAAVRANIAEYVRTALAGEWDAWGRTLATDVAYMPPSQAPIMGRDAAVTFGKSFPKLTSLSVSPEDVRGRGDVAYARGKYSYAATLPDGSSASESGSFLDIHRRQPDGSWLYTHAIWHSDSPPPAPTMPK